MDVEKKIDSQLVHSSRVFNVYEDKVVLPNDRETMRGWVDHGKSVAMIPINEQNEIILIKQYRYATQEFLLEIPAGNMDKEGEDIEACVQRELAEEIGYKAKNLEKVFEGYSLPGYCTEYMYYYIASDLYPEKLEADDDEFIEIMPVSFENIDKMIKKGKIKDLKTALGFYLAKGWLSRRG